MSSTGSMMAHVALICQHARNGRAEMDPFLLILDHACSHKTKPFKEWCATHGVCLLYIPERATSVLQMLDLTVNQSIRASMRYWWLHDTKVHETMRVAGFCATAKSRCLEERFYKTCRSLI